MQEALTTTVCLPFFKFLQTTGLLPITYVNMYIATHCHNLATCIFMEALSYMYVAMTLECAWEFK